MDENEHQTPRPEEAPEARHMRAAFPLSHPITESIRSAMQGVGKDDIPVYTYRDELAPGAGLSFAPANVIHGPVIRIDATWEENPPELPAHNIKRTLSIRNAANDAIVTISLEDGGVQFGPSYTADQAAEAFWAAVRRNF